MYIQDSKILVVFISDVQASDFQAGSSLAKLSLVGLVGGPRLVLDTQLVIGTYFSSKILDIYGN